MTQPIDSEPIHEHDLAPLLAAIEAAGTDDFRADEVLPVEVAAIPKKLVAVPRAVAVEIDWGQDPSGTRGVLRALGAILLDREIDVWTALSGSMNWPVLGTPPDWRERIRRIPVAWDDPETTPFGDLFAAGSEAWMNPDTLKRIYDHPRSRALPLSLLEQIATAVDHGGPGDLVIEHPLDGRRLVIHTVTAKYLGPNDRLRYVLGDVVAAVAAGAGKTWRQPAPRGGGWALTEHRSPQGEPSRVSRLTLEMVEAVEWPAAGAVLVLP